MEIFKTGHNTLQVELTHGKLLAIYHLAEQAVNRGNATILQRELYDELRSFILTKAMGRHQ